MGVSDQSPTSEVLPEDLWVGLVAVVRAAFDRDYDALQVAVRQHPVLAEIDQERRAAGALQIMAYIALARRIDHRPIVDADAVVAAQQLTPRISEYTWVDFSDVADAARAALFLPVVTKARNAETANRIGGIWISIIGTRVDDFSEVLGMRSDVERALRPRT